MSVEKSKKLFEQSKKSLAGGVSSAARAKGPFPIFFEKGKGPYLYDVDGNKYIDYYLGSGPDIFGHAPDFLNDAVIKDMQKGQVFGAQHPSEITISEKIQSIVPCAELVRYASSGTEAVQLAIRVARAYTKKNKKIKFEGHYHGWMDSIGYIPNPSLNQPGGDESPPAVPISEGIAKGTEEEIILLPWNNIEILKECIKKNADNIGVIITEAILCNTNTIMPKPGYLEEMRELCNDNNIVLIFDEVITGFRVALGGAQELLGVTPDLATFAKAMAGGYPISMVAGKKEIMSLIGDGSVFHGGTLNSNVMSVSATEAALNKLSANDGAVYKHIYELSNELMEGFRKISIKYEVPMIIQGPGPTFSVSFTDAEEITDYRSHIQNIDSNKYKKYCEKMLENGVHIWPDGRYYVSSEHTKEDILKTLEAADKVIGSL